jgi:hypothetical protein
MSMVTIAPVFEDSLRREGADSGPSAVSWPAVFAGAVAAAALSLILLVLGTGLGLSVVSPWAARGASAEAMSWSTILWISFCALASSGLGGYIAGRLRVKWPAVHGDEVYFRDTAHGFLAWAVATLITAAALTSVIGAILNAGANAAATVAAGGVQAVGQGMSAAAPAADRDASRSLYTVESLFRTAPAATAPVNPATPASPSQPDASAADTRSEIARIFDNGIHDGPLSAEDTRYIGQIVAQRTGLSQPEAEARVTTIYTTAQQKLQQAEAAAKEAADQARKAGAYAALWIFVSLLMGAFFASLMATVGGRRRDQF